VSSTEQQRAGAREPNVRCGRRRTTAPAHCTRRVLVLRLGFRHRPRRFPRAQAQGIVRASYTEVMLTQFSFFLGLSLLSIPAGLVLSRAGYMRSTVLGLVVMASGCLLFAPAAAIGSFSAFLFALFVMAAGITLLQVVPIRSLRDWARTATSSSRLTLPRLSTRSARPSAPGSARPSSSAAGSR